MKLDKPLMIKLPKLVGEIRKVPLSAYEEIINNYVAKVSVLPAIKSIIQMGSFTAPGLSDIDLIVVIKDGHKAPAWDDISLLKLSDAFEYKEVIAHDIFVINEFIAKNAEAYFYIDAQVVLYGDSLGGNIDKSTIRLLSSFLSLEYSVFTIESLFKLLLRDEVNLRNALLLLSTSRHTAAKAAKLDIISSNELKDVVDQVEKLRLQFLEGLQPYEELNSQYYSFLQLLFKVIQIDPVSTKLVGNIGSGETKKVSNKTEFYWMSKPSEYVDTFVNCIKVSKQLLFKGRFSLVPIPEVFSAHLAGYNNMNSSKSYIDKKNLRMSKELKIVYDLRKQVILEHWDFIDKYNYSKSSGKAYCGFGYSPEMTFSRKLVFYGIRMYTKFSVLRALKKLN